MTVKERWNAEMMTTPELANECRIAKELMRQARHMINRYKDGADKRAHAKYRKDYRDARLKHNELSKILKSRQLTMF